MTLLQAIAKEEGFYVLGARPMRNNNPGDLIYGDEAKRFGALRGDPKFAVFVDGLAGFDALRRWLSVPAHIVNGQLEAGYLGATLRQVIMRFAPEADGNDVAEYIANVCANTGLTEDAVITAALLR